MNTNDNTDVIINLDQNGTVSYVRLDGNSTIGSCSSMIISNCSSDEENDDNHHIPPLKWKRQEILNYDSYKPEPLPNGSDVLKNLHLDRDFAISTKENVAALFDDELQSLPSRRLPPIPEDKLHRRNPHTVRQELKMLDDLIPETDSMDIHLNEMPGLQNTEQWKRIADRAVHSSPPLSRQYYQTVISTLQLQDVQVPQPLGSYRRPGRSENEQGTPNNGTCQWRAPRRRVLLGSFIAVVIVAIVVAVVLAVTIVQKTVTTTTDYYEGTVYVLAKFDKSLLIPTSTLARSYKREFCSLIGTTLADARTKYAVYYSSCTVTAFYNGSIIADFVLGFTRYQNVTRLNLFLNRSLVNTQLFGGNISSITFNLTLVNPNRSNNTNSSNDYYDDGYDNYDASHERDKLIMTEPNSTTELQQQQPTHTSYTTVTYTTLEKGLSITISETITITNNNLDKSPINNKNYEVILIPTIDNTKSGVLSTGSTNEKTLLPPPTPLPPATTNIIPRESPSQRNLLQSIKPITDTNFAYIDESSDDRTCSSGDVLSTIEDLTTQDSATTASTISFNDGTLTDSNSTLADTFILPSRGPPSRPTPPNRPPIKTSTESNEERRSFPSRPYPNAVKRERRMIVPKNSRRLLQYELMPTGKVYYVDRPFYNENKNLKGINDDNSSAVLSTILSRSSSLDTVSDKHHRHQRHNRKYYHDLSLKKPEQKLSIGGRLASNNNLITPSTTAAAMSSFKPINSFRKNRFSSFEPTRESLDRVFDVILAADKRRGEHDFWREKFDHRTPNSRAPVANSNRTHETTISNTIPFPRSKQTQLTPSSALSNVNNRSQSYTSKRTSFYEGNNRQSGCLLEDCLRRRTQIAQQQSQPERNYSPNTIYTTNYPKQQFFPTGKPPLPKTTTTAVQQPVRILPLSNGRIGRAPQARQTSDELSTISEVWATRSSFEDQSRHPKKSSNHTRFASVANRSRTNEQKTVSIKRASSAGQQKPHRTPNKTLSTTKSRFFDLFKFTR